MPLIGNTEDHIADDATTLAPITRERIEATLTTLEVNYGKDSDGDLVAGFDGNPCWFRISGPAGEDIAFVFDARWRHELPGELYGEALDTVNEWNAENMFPRAVTMQINDGQVIFGADFVRDYEFGVTDMQLRNEITIAITMTIRYWEMLDERFGDKALDPVDPVEG